MSWVAVAAWAANVAIDFTLSYYEKKERERKEREKAKNDAKKRNTGYDGDVLQDGFAPPLVWGTAILPGYVIRYERITESKSYTIRAYKAPEREDILGFIPIGEYGDAKLEDTDGFAYSNFCGHLIASGVDRIVATYIKSPRAYSYSPNINVRSEGFFHPIVSHRVPTDTKYYVGLQMKDGHRLVTANRPIYETSSPTDKQQSLLWAFRDETSDEPFYAATIYYPNGGDHNSADVQKSRTPDFTAYDLDVNDTKTPKYGGVLPDQYFTGSAYEGFALAYSWGFTNHDFISEKQSGGVPPMYFEVFRGGAIPAELQQYAEVVVSRSWLPTVVSKISGIAKTTDSDKFLIDASSSIEKPYAAPAANPACIVLDLLTSKEYGLGLDVSDIDIQSFITAAEVLSLDSEGYDVEYYGGEPMSLISDIVDASDGILFTDQDTRLVTYVLLRPDDNVVKTLTDRDIVGWSDISREPISVAPNKLEFEYVDYTGVVKSIPSYNSPNISRSGVVNTVSLRYDFVKSDEVANKMAARKFNAICTAPLRCVVQVPSSVAIGIKQGSVLSIESDTIDLIGLTGAENSNFRVVDVEESPMDVGVSNIILMTNVWDSPGELDYARKELGTISIELAPLKPIYAEEMPTILVNAPMGSTSFFVGAVEMEPTPPQGLTPYKQVTIGADSAIVSDPIFSTTPKAYTLVSDIGYLDSNIDVINVEGISQGTLLWVGGELVQKAQSGFLRGCHDTIPKKHAAGSILVEVASYGAYSTSLILPFEPVPESYSDTKVFRSIPCSGDADPIIGSTEGALEQFVNFPKYLNDETIYDSYDFYNGHSSRAYKATRPTRVAINGVYFPQNVSGDLTLTFETPSKFEDSLNSMSHFLSLSSEELEHRPDYNNQLLGVMFTITRFRNGIEQGTVGTRWFGNSGNPKSLTITQAQETSSLGAPQDGDVYVVRVASGWNDPGGVGTSHQYRCWEPYEFEVTRNGNLTEGWGFDHGNNWGN